MTEYVTVSAKIPRELRERARELGISPSEVIKRALEEEVKRREVEELTKRLKETKPLLTEPEETVRMIKEIRDEGVASALHFAGSRAQRRPP